MFTQDLQSLIAKKYFWYYFLTTSAIVGLFIVMLYSYFHYRIFSTMDRLRLKLRDYKKRLQEIEMISVYENLSGEEALRFRYYDKLTNLPNRIYFNEILTKYMTHAKRHKKFLALLFIDIDNFDKVNLQYGEDAGDEILIKIANAFKETLRTDDLIARFGSDEFMLLLSDLDDAKYVGSIADKLMTVAKKEITYQKKPVPMTISMGIAIYPNDGDTLEELEKNTDKALFKAKQDGGNQYRFTAEQLQHAALEYLQLESALRSALTNNELILYYQPQLSLEKGEIKSVEALIRWEHPHLGLIHPEKFIPIAEKTGLIHRIGEWTINEACKTIKIWQDEGYQSLTVAINISSSQFHDPQLKTQLAETLKKYNLSGESLEIEVSESTVMHDIEYAVEKLNSLKELGICIALDDFGTGYTSINYLRQFPLSVLKIDQTFIRGIPHNRNDAAITSAVINLGHNIGLNVVAEGVENIKQIQYLAEHKCDLIQGYFFSRPLPAAKVVMQFKKRNKSTHLAN